MSYKKTDNYVEGKVVVITGGSSGFGMLTAQKVAAMGGLPVIGARREEKLKEVADSIIAAGGKCIYKATDVSQRADVEALVALAVETYGRVDVLVNNAGTMPLARFCSHKMAMPAWEQCIDIVLKGTLYGMCAVHDRMMAQGSGQIINVSSVYANYPVSGAGVYQACKIGVKYLADCFRKECEGKIKVSTIMPSAIIGTGLFDCILEQEAMMGMIGENMMEAFGMLQEYPGRPDLQDTEGMGCFCATPEALAENIVYLINQPLGINISDITVRGSNERWIL